MKTAVFSDIHGNLEALQAVLQDIEEQGGVDRYWSLGDLTDYGPDSHLCLQKVRQINALNILGNHDAAVCGKLDYRQKFGGDFAQVTAWTEAHLADADKDYLAGLPIRIETTGFTLVHGSPRDPFWEYLLDADRAVQNLPFLNTPYCLVGHSHVSACFKPADPPDTVKKVAFTRAMDDQYFKDGKFSFHFKAIKDSRVSVDHTRMFLNPGAVGQQRDHDPRAAYAVYNDASATFEFRRVEYNLSLTLQKMRAAGLPEWLIKRMAVGT